MTRLEAMTPKFGFRPFRDAGTVHSAAQFRARIEAFQRHFAEKHHALVKNVLFEALTELVRMNPIGNQDRWERYIEHPHWKRQNYVGGHSSRNWQVSTQPLVPEKPGTGNAQAISEGQAAIGAIPMGTKKAYLVNPVPYMERLNEGWSSVAPDGWINYALAKVIAKYRKVQ